MHIDDAATTAPRAGDLRIEAAAQLERAEELRRQAEACEQAAWSLQARAAVLEAGERTNRAPRHRPAISGDPKMAFNRVIAMMERLAIDEPLHAGEGLDAPLRRIEARLGICYARRGKPTVGSRVAAAEEALLAVS